MKKGYHRNHRNRCNHSGFSIIELVFAMMFLTIIILGVVSLQTSNLGMMNGQKNQIQAHFLATQGAQIAKGLGYSSLPNCGTICSQKIILDESDINNKKYGLSAIPPETKEEIEVGNQKFYRTIQILKPGPSMPNSAKVASIVEWTDSTGPHLKDEIDPETLQPMNSHVEADLIVF